MVSAGRSPVLETIHADHFSYNWAQNLKALFGYGSIFLAMWCTNLFLWLFRLYMTGFVVLTSGWKWDNAIALPQFPHVCIWILPANFLCTLWIIILCDALKFYFFFSFFPFFPPFFFVWLLVKFLYCFNSYFVLES